MKVLVSGCVMDFMVCFCGFSGSFSLEEQAGEESMFLSIKCTKIK